MAVELLLAVPVQYTHKLVVIFDLLFSLFSFSYTQIILLNQVFVYLMSFCLLDVFLVVFYFFISWMHHNLIFTVEAYFSRPIFTIINHIFNNIFQTVHFFNSKIHQGYEKKIRFFKKFQQTSLKFWNNLNIGLIRADSFKYVLQSQPSIF